MFVKWSASKPLACAIAYDTRHRSREFAELCAQIMAAAGFKVWFLDGYRSTPEAVVRRSLQELRLRHHDHRQPQSAHRQRREGLLVDRRPVAAAARQRRDRSGLPRQGDRADAVGRGTGLGPDRVLPGRGRCGLRRGGPAAEHGRAARSEDHLFAAARRGRIGGLPGAGGGRIRGRGGLRPARRARSRFHQRAGPRGQSGERRRLRRHDRPRQGDRRGLDPGHRPRLRPPGLRRPADPCRRRCLGNADRQPDRLAADRFAAGRPQGGRHASSRACTSSRRWSPRS